MKHIKTINKANLTKTASVSQLARPPAQLLTRSAREKLNIPIFLRRASVHTPC